MAYQVYRKGESHNVRGVQCELKNIKPSELEEYLSNGWVTSPNGLNDEPEQTESDNVETINPIRQAAKDAGIEGWEKKRIKTLQAELDGNED